MPDKPASSPNNKQIVRRHTAHGSISSPSDKKLKSPIDIIKKSTIQNKEKEETDKSFRLSRVSSCKQLDQPKNKLIKLVKNSQHSTQDNLTMSYLLDQDVSINFHETTETVVRDFESERKNSQPIIESSIRSCKLDITSTPNKKLTNQSTAQLTRNSLINTQPVQVIKKKIQENTKK